MEKILVVKIDFGDIGALYLDKKNYDNYTLGDIEEELLILPCVLNEEGLISKDYADEVNCKITFLNMEKEKFNNLPEWQV